MSHISTMTLYVSHDDAEAMSRVNAWCAERDEVRAQQFCRLDTERAGGTKVFCAGVWAMAGNYFPHEDLIEMLPSFGWRAPWRVVLIVGGEDDDVPQVHRVASA